MNSVEALACQVIGVQLLQVALLSSCLSLDSVGYLLCFVVGQCLRICVISAAAPCYHSIFLSEAFNSVLQASASGLPF